MRIRISLSNSLRQGVMERLKRAYKNSQLRLVRRIHVLLAIVEGKGVREVAESFGLGEQTVRDYVNLFLSKGMASLDYR